MHHGAGLRAALEDEGFDDPDPWIEKLAKDHATLEMEPADRAMLAYAAKLTKTPGEMNRDDVGALRAAGFDDRGIHDICAIVSYYAFVNRIADGLGVELEERFPPKPEGG